MHEFLNRCPVPDHTSVEIRNRLEINYSARFGGGQRKSGEKAGGGGNEERREEEKEQLVDPLSSCRRSVCVGGLVWWVRRNLQPAGAPQLQHSSANGLWQATIKRNNSPCLIPSSASLGRARAQVRASVTS